MEWKEIARDWNLFRAGIKRRWALVSDAHLDLIAGNRERLIDRIRYVYGLSREQTEKQVADWLRRLPRPPRVG